MSAPNMILACMNHSWPRLLCVQVYVWDVHSCKMQYKLPGHTGSVNEVVFHPKEPIIASASSDRSIYLGELSV